MEHAGAGVDRHEGSRLPETRRRGSKLAHSFGLLALIGTHIMRKMPRAKPSTSFKLLRVAPRGASEELSGPFEMAFCDVILPGLLTAAATYFAAAPAFAAAAAFAAATGKSQSQGMWRKEPKSKQPPLCEFALFEHENCGGEQLGRPIVVDTGCVHQLEGAYNDRASSISYQGPATVSCRAKIYEHSNEEGHVITFLPLSPGCANLAKVKPRQLIDMASSICVDSRTNLRDGDATMECTLGQASWPLEERKSGHPAQRATGLL